MTIIQVISVAPIALGASHRASSAPARQTRRIVRATGLTVRSILSTGGGGGDLMSGLLPAGTLACRHEEGRRPSRRRPCAIMGRSRCLGGARRTRAKVGQPPVFNGIAFCYE